MESAGATGEQATKPRKPRSDKGKKRERAFMVTVDRDDEIVCWPQYATAQEAIDNAASCVKIGESCSVWQRVGKPRTAQMRLL